MQFSPEFLEMQSIFYMRIKFIARFVTLPQTREIVFCVSFNCLCKPVFSNSDMFGKIINFTLLKVL